jgi:hypothetical protein
MKKTISLMLVAAFAAFLLTSATGAMGGEEERAMTAQGRCSVDTIWGLTMEPEVGVKFEAHLETGVPDQRWQVLVFYNQHVLIKTIEVTEEDGGFEVVKVENNAQGDDDATLRAVNLDTGELCWGRLRAEL